MLTFDTASIYTKTVQYECTVFSNFFKKSALPAPAAIQLLSVSRVF